MALGPLPAVAAVPTLVPLAPPGAQDGHAYAGPLPPQDLQAAVAEPALEVLAQAARPALQAQGGGVPALVHAPDGAGLEPLPAALRLDQSVLQQIAWRVPDAVRLASSWRATLLQAAGRQGGEAEGRLRLAAEGAAAEAAILSPTHAPPAPAARGTPGAAALPGWINVYAWGGMQAMLGVLTLEADEAAPPPRRRHRVGALRFALDVPGLGRIHACLHLTEAGVALDLSAQTRALMQYVRERLPAIAAAFGHAGPPLARCRLLDLAGLERAGQASAGLPAGLVLDPGLFHAATQLWAVLAPPLAAAVSRGAAST